MKSSNLLFIQKCLTESSCCYHDSLPYLTITSAMMLLFDNSISIGDTFSCLTNDTKGLFTSIDVADIKKISNAIYSFALDGDYQSAHLLNPCNNIPLDYATLSYKVNSCDTVIGALEHACNVELPVEKTDLFTNNSAEPRYFIGKLIFATELLKELPSYIVHMKDVALHDLDLVVLKGLLKHPVFVCELDDGTYEVYICTHNIPNGMSSDHFECIGVDNEYLLQNINDGKDRSVTRYVSTFKYKLPKYYIKEINEAKISTNLRSFRDILIEHSSKKRGSITPRLLYLNKGSQLISSNNVLKLNYDPASKEVLYTYKHIYKEIGLKPNKVWFSNINYIHGYNRNWLSK